jgi:RNA polymerase sigma-70 factor (ECF subfamily)
MRCLDKNSGLTDFAATTDEPSDETLIAQLAAGDREKIVLLLVRYAPRVLSLATATVDRSAAEEIVQDVCVQVWRGASSFDPARGSFRTWLFAITHSRIANELRRRGRRPDTRATNNDAEWTSVADPAPTPDDKVWLDFRRQTLQAAVDSLPVKQRQAISLAFFEELTHEQVGASLDVPLGTAKSRIRSAFETLRGQLTPVRASFLVGLFLLAGLARTEHRQSVRLEQERRALWLVTTSDVVPVRLEPLPGIDPKTHGTYRGRAGETLALMTFSNFSPAPAGQQYRAWCRHGDHWTELCIVPLDAAGSGRLIAEDPSLTKRPDAVRVTLDRGGNQTRPGSDDTPIIAWPAEK